MIDDDPFLMMYKDLRDSGKSHDEAWASVLQMISTPDNLVFLIECLEEPAGHELLALWMEAWTHFNLRPPWGDLVECWKISTSAYAHKAG